VLVLAIVIVLSLGILVVIKSTGNLTNVKIKNLQELKAQYLAEAGMTHANWRCNTNPAGCVTETISVASPNDVSIVVTPTPTAMDPKASKIVVSVNYPDL